jgi:hypothetical protein
MQTIQVALIRFLALGACFLQFGCAHVDRARAEHHEAKAERAAEHGHFRKAVKEERKAHRAEENAERDPLP